MKLWLLIVPSTTLILSHSLHVKLKTIQLFFDQQQTLEIQELMNLFNELIPIAVTSLKMLSSQEIMPL
jgi:hypothetical protein